MSITDIFELNMPKLNRSRTIRVYVPKKLTADTRYPVLYMHDGQNLFDPETSGYVSIWNVVSAIETPGAPKVIVVGIDSASGIERFNEYSPWPSHTIKELKDFEDVTSNIGGLGSDYIDFIVNTLKPYIDAHYPTLTDRLHTAMAGSSMGGLISLYAGIHHSDTFSKIGAFSTAAWFAEPELLAELSRIDMTQPIRWYLDIGTKESSNDICTDFNDIYLKGTQRIYTQLIALGVSSDQLKCVIEADAIHHETAWARRFPAALDWLFKRTD